jgi:hypothetical protein
MSPSRFTPEQMRERAKRHDSLAIEFWDEHVYELNGGGLAKAMIAKEHFTTHSTSAAMLRQSASDAEALQKAREEIDLRERARQLQAVMLESAFQDKLAAESALADLQRKVKELREAFRTHHDIAEAAKHMAIAKRDSQLQLAWGSVAEAWVNAVLLVDAIPALTPSPEQGASK